MRILQQDYPTVDGCFNYLRSQGYEGSLNDMMYQFLGDQGYSGGLPDRLLSSNYFPTIPVSVGDSFLIESGDYLLLENGDKLLLEA